MAGSITVSSITLDSDNNFSIRSNTGATILSANGTGLITGIASGSAITNAQLTTPTVSGNLNLDSTGTSGVRLPAANTLTFHTSGTEDMRLDTNGNLFLGATSSPLNSTKLLSFATADQSGITVNSTNASQTNDVVLIRNTRNTSNGTYNALTVYNDGAGAYRFQLTDGGNIGLFGGQIKFPATQNPSADANTLDDYEEGTFTPTAFGAGSAGTTTYTTQAGTYTKIGRQVTLTFAINYTALTGTGELRYGNFPFTSGAPEFIGAIMTNGLNWSSGSSIVLYVVPNSTNGVLFGSTDDSGWSPQQCVNESADVRCTITYFT